MEALNVLQVCILAYDCYQRKQEFRRYYDNFSLSYSPSQVCQAIVLSKGKQTIGAYREGQINDLITDTYNANNQSMMLGD